ncbi:MAG: M13 family metallopeptidase [Pseudobdellovibrionaceae bacterium]
MVSLIQMVVLTGALMLTQLVYGTEFNNDLHKVARELTSHVSNSASNSAPGSVLDPSIIDPNISPCDDFFQYACGKWLKNTKIPSDRASFFRFSAIDLNTENILKNILENYKKGQYHPAQRNASQMGSFYQSCMDTQAAEQAGKKGVRNLLLQIESLKKVNKNQRAYALALLTAKLHQQGIPVFFDFSIGQDPGDAQQILPQLDQGGTGLPEKSYYFDADMNDSRSKYLIHIAKMFKAVGITKGTAFAQAAFNFEKSLAAASLSSVERRDPKAIYNKMTLEQFKELAPNFDWNTYFSTLGIPQSANFNLNVSVPKYFNSLGQLLAVTSGQDLENYLKWYVLHSVAGYSFEALIKENFDFYGKFLNGQKAARPRWKDCISSVDMYLGEALGDSFVQVAFGVDAKKLAISMMNQIQNVVRDMFTHLDWMDSHTMEGALRKINTLVKKVGYPDHARNYDALSVDRTSWFDNVVAGKRFDMKTAIGKIGKAVDKTEWDMTAPTDNAYYNASFNEIVFPAGILQNPLFNVKADLAANYGATGATVGHEMTHGFDDEGRQYDENGNLNDWWSASSTERFKEKTQCLINQYNQYPIAGGSHVNGELTLGENIADLGGLKIALKAFLKVSAEPVQKNDYQRFFVAYAQSWCGKSTDEYEKSMNEMDPHSPARYRVNGVIANMPEFGAAFSCKQEQAMNPVKRCEIW